MNYPQQSAQGLASLGRGNDSMLVHMTPREVQGLQSLAMAHGGSLSINPETGLPEAGFLDTIFNIALPVAGGFFGLDPFLVAGIMGGKSLVEEGDPFKAALAGFGGYSGAKMGVNLKDFTTPLKVPTAVTSTFDDAAANLDKIDTSKLMQAEGGIKPAAFPDTTPYNRLEVPNFNVGKAGYNVPASGVEGKLDLGIPANLKDPTVPPSAGIKDIGYDSFSSTPAAQVPNAINPIEPMSPISAVAKNPVGFARQVGDGNALAGAAKMGLYGFSPFAEDALTPPEYVGYEDPEKGKYLSDTGGLSFNPKYSTGLKLLPNLNQPIRAAEGGYIDGYATGGSIQSGGIRDLYGTPDNQPTISPGLSGFGLGRLNNLAGEQAMTQAQTLGYADGGDVSNYRQDQAALNLDKQRALNLDLVPSLNVETGKQNYTTPESFMYNFYTGNIPSDSLGPLGQLYSYTMKGKLNDGSTVGQNLYDGMMKSRTKMAKGGYLDGAGDGMSDSIPATIEGKQPARLADGEFVVPADVVSHLGNGSSKAGSKRLYAMLDKVRHARTGNKKQGKEIKAEKYLPA